jgi:hypothetical protein
MASEAPPPPDQGVSFYTDPTDRLSQGDVVFGVPPLVVQHPITICRQGGKDRGTAKQGWFNTAVAAQPPAFGKGPETVHARGREPGFGIVIWEDCQIDKMKSQGHDPAKWYVAVAPVAPLSSIQEVHRAPIIEGRRLAFFPLPGVPALGLPDSYVDLRMVYPIQQEALTKRLTTLSTASRAVLYGHLFQFLTARRFPGEIICPHCHAPIDAANLLQPADE